MCVFFNNSDGYIYYEADIIEDSVTSQIRVVSTSDFLYKVIWREVQT